MDSSNGGVVGSTMSINPKGGNALGTPGARAAGSTSVGGLASFQSNRDSRTMGTIKMKDEQLRILSDQNQQLLSSLDQVEEEANTVQLEKLAVEEENRTMRDQNFELQSKARAAESQLKKSQAEMADKDKQLKIMTDQNSELLRLLETEEAQTSKLELENQQVRSEADTLKGKYGSLLTTAKTHEEMAARAAREGQLRAEEVRLLRAETEQLRTANSEMKMKTQVELEALHEQLRVRKEKQYQLLEKLQGQEEAKRQAEDQVASMEEKLRALHAKNVELETQLQVETRAKRSQQEANKKLMIESEHLTQNNKELQSKIDRCESERLRMEAEARDSSEQLREMAEKVFQLLERLKLAELGKTKAVEALRRKEQEMLALKKKNSRLLKEGTNEGKARVKAELDKKVLVDQIRALKKHNSQLSARCREEVKDKLKEMEEKKASQEKVRTLGGRLSFLLNKMQADEEAKVVAREEMQKMQAQIKTMQERNEELSQKLQATGESNRIITQAMRFKQEELDELCIKHDALQKTMQKKEFAGGDDSDAEAGDGPEVPETGEMADDAQQVRDSGGKGRFHVEAKPAQGLLVVRGKSQKAKEFLERHGVNQYLKKAQRSANVKQLMVERLSSMLGLLMVEEEEKEHQVSVVTDNRDEIEHLSRKTLFLQEKLGREEDTKRRTLLRYVHAVKAAASPQDMSLSGTSEVRIGSLQLPESGIGNEEVHAVAALLRGNTTITELNLRGNAITDEGARAMAAVLAGRSHLRNIDLRGNQIGKGGVRAMAEALERSERVRHVYVHAGGKVEALGTGSWAQGQEGEDGGASMVTVETVCVVDARDNTTEAEPEFATAAGSAANSTQNAGNSTKKAGTAALGSVKKSGKIDMRKSVERKKERLKRMEKRRHGQAKAAQDKNLEAGWAGRAGGYEAGVTNSLPPLANGKSSDNSIARSTSAPALKSKGNATQYTRRLQESPLATSMSKK